VSWKNADARTATEALAVLAAVAVLPGIRAREILPDSTPNHCAYLVFALRAAGLLREPHDWTGRLYITDIGRIAVSDGEAFRSKWSRGQFLQRKAA
jgi:hypothetical protein